MAIAPRKGRIKRGSVMKKIKVKGNVDKGRDVIVCCKTATLKCEGFQSYMAMWNKMYGCDVLTEIKFSC